MSAWRLSTQILSLSLTLSAVVPAVAAASAASQQYKSGTGALEEGRPLEAIEYLEEACRLAPNKDKYREALEEARNAAARELIAQATEKRQIVDQLPLLERALGYSAVDPQVQAFRAAADRRLRTLRDQVVAAQAGLDNGERRSALSVLQSMEGLDPWVPELVDLRNAMSLPAALESLEAAINSDLRAALERLDLWHKRLGDDEIPRLNRAVFGAVEPFLHQLVLNLDSNTYQPSSRAGQILALAQRSCEGPACEQVAAARRRIVSRILSPTDLDLLADHSDDPVEEFGRCQILSRISELTGPITSDLGLAGPCTPVPRPGLRLAARFVPDETCAALSIQELDAFRDSLDWSDGDGQTASVASESQDAEVELLLLLANCSTAVIEQRNAAVKASEYAAGIQQLANPSYQTILTQLQQAQIELVTIPNSCLCFGPCTDFAVGICRAAKQIAVTTLQNRLNSTPPYLQRTVKMPYRYEEFEVAAEASLAAGLVLRRPDVDALVVFEQLTGQASSSQQATRGILPNDANGLREHPPPEIDRRALLLQALADLGPRVVKAVRNNLPRWFLYSAARAKTEGRDLLAIGQLLRADTTAAPSTGGEVWRLLRQDPPALHGVLAALPPTDQLETAFEDLVEATPAVVSEAAEAPAEDVIEEALRATVVVVGISRLGSGFFVTPTGLIVTNNHVIEGDDTVEVITRAGDRFLGRILQRSPKDDLALIQVDASGMPFLRLAESAGVRIGSDVFAVGSPEGLEGSVSRGIVSAIRILDGAGPFVQTDAAINQGNSGGPLINRQGLVVGVNTWKVGDAEGVNFAISSDLVRTVFRDRIGISR